MGVLSSDLKLTKLARWLLGGWDFEERIDKRAFEEIIMETGFYDCRELIWNDIQSYADPESPYTEGGMEALIRLFSTFDDHPKPLVDLLNRFAQHHGIFNAHSWRYVLDEITPEDFAEDGILVYQKNPGFFLLNDNEGGMDLHDDSTQNESLDMDDSFNDGLSRGRITDDALEEESDALPKSTRERTGSKSRWSLVFGEIKKPINIIVFLVSFLGIIIAVSLIGMTSTSNYDIWVAPIASAVVSTLVIGIKLMIHFHRIDSESVYSEKDLESKERIAIAAEKQVEISEEELNRRKGAVLRRLAHELNHILQELDCNNTENVIFGKLVEIEKMGGMDFVSRETHELLLDLMSSIGDYHKKKAEYRKYLEVKAFSGVDDAGVTSQLVFSLIGKCEGIKVKIEALFKKIQQMEN